VHVAAAPEGRRRCRPRRPNARNARGRHRGAYPPEQRRAAVEAFLAAGQPLRDFARIWGVSRKNLSLWVKRYRAEGPQALEHRPRGRPPGATRSSDVGRRLAQPIRNLIGRTRMRFPDFGLKRIAQFLARFHPVRVSTGGVRSALEHAGLPAAAEIVRRRRCRGSRCHANQT
jgi:transposase